ncbi:DUF3168 domain-containing protein [Atrimonas thermophila]|uniref:DUF3168 domain-containing protein n=1 Tax=Atrimonas thermophila TaxID=3064161 RepID=UPI00399CA717
MMVALQKAIYQRLVSQLSYPVYDSVPDGATFPYIVIGEDIGSDYSTKDFHGGDVVATIHIFSDYKGAKEAKEIADAVVETLNDDINIENLSLASLRLENLRVFEEPERIWHAVVQMRFKVFKSA